MERRPALQIHSSEEVREALDAGRPVVALETALVTHGLPEPIGLETAAMAESAVRESGSISKVWSGKLVFPEASAFKANAYVISGNVSGSVARTAFGKQMQIQGRIPPSSAGEVGPHRNFQNLVLLLNFSMSNK